jgi:hypothetical protein
MRISFGGEWENGEGQEKEREARTERIRKTERSRIQDLACSCSS